MTSLVSTETALRELNLELQLKVKELTNENQLLQVTVENLQISLDKTTEKLQNYEDLSESLSNMRDQVNKVTNALIKKRAEADQLKGRLDAATKDSERRIMFLQEKLNLVRERKSQLEIGYSNDGSTIFASSDNENLANTSCTVNTSNGSNYCLSSGSPLSRSTQQLQQQPSQQRKLERVENRLLSRVRGYNPRKSMSSEDLSTATSGKMRKIVLHTHLQMRGRLPPLQPSSSATKEPLKHSESLRSKVTGSAAVSRSNTQINVRKPFRC